MKASISVLLAICVAASIQSEAGEPSPSLDRAARQTVIAAAIHAVKQHKSADENTSRGTDIPKAFWGDAIARLKPLRVRDDFWHNVFIILKEDETSEEGFYVRNHISSYLPGHDVRFLVFEKLTEADDDFVFGEIYRCKLRKAQPDGASSPSQPSRAETKPRSQGCWLGSFIANVGGGLVLLGFGFLVMDFFMARLAPSLKRRGVHDKSDQEMLVSIAKPEDRRRIKWANLNYEAAITHRMRRGGLIVMVAGLVLLLAATTFQFLTK